MQALRALTVLVVVTAVGMLSAPAVAVPIAPSQVPGKEYSNHPDETFNDKANPLSNIAWDGLGGSWNTFDYSGSNAQFIENDNVDALANIQDHLFWEVTHDTCEMLVSFEDTTGLKGNGNIHYQDAGVNVTGVWATPATIASPKSPDDVDGLEVWGPEVSPGIGDDANMFSLIADPYGTAVYYYDSVNHVSFPYITQFQIQCAIDTEELVDLDAMMIYDVDGDDQFGTGDSIMFSVHETISAGGAYDGGEIWVWTCGAPAQFLVHGGVVWNTAHTVGADFGVQTEEVNALEAVPEPPTLGLLLIGGGLALMRRRQP
jgi:hypothetical protein